MKPPQNTTWTRSSASAAAPPPGLAKAIALTTGLPVVAVPTTYAGSEATAVWGLTEGDRKTTGTDPRVLPKVIVYDATLTRHSPGRRSASRRA